MKHGLWIAPDNLVFPSTPTYIQVSLISTVGFYKDLLIYMNFCVVIPMLCDTLKGMVMVDESALALVQVLHHCTLQK